MHGSLRRLLHESIDYAGLFPPAGLEMREALAEYLRLELEHEEILGRFVCTATRLGELASETAALTGTPFLPVSVVGGASAASAWHAQRAEDARLIRAFLGGVGERADVEAYEVAVPAEAPVSVRAADFAHFGQAEIYLELPWGEGLGERLACLAEAQLVGAKARTSPPPPSAELAEFLHTCVALDLPFKLTAGLHTAFGRPGGEFGFLSVLGAAALAMAEDLSRREVEGLLVAGADEWRYDEDGLTCRGFRAGVGDIEAAREIFVSFGSCSVREPVAELGRYGLISEAARVQDRLEP